MTVSNCRDAGEWPADSGRRKRPAGKGFVNPACGLFGCLAAGVPGRITDEYGRVFERELARFEVKNGKLE